MHRRRTQLVSTLLLLVCLACPLVEMFDHWDHTVQTGNDTEYTLVVVALCIGLLYSFARLVSKPVLLGFLSSRMFGFAAREFWLSASCCFAELLSDATSPPALPLRI